MPDARPSTQDTVRLIALAVIADPRGGHAHKELQQVVFALAGSFRSATS